MKLPQTAPSTSALPRLCVLFPGALGDFVCVLPALHHLARHAQVEVFARNEYADLVPHNIKIQSIERPEIARLFVTGGAQENPVRDFFGVFQAVYSWTGSGQRVFVDQLGQVAKSHVYPFRPSAPAQHQADYYFSCVAADTAAPPPAIPLLPSALHWWEDYRDRHGFGDQPLLVVAPGSGALAKNWPANSFAAVANWWRRERNGRVLTLLGPVEAARGVPGALPDSWVLNSPTLGDAAALLSRCQLYLGNDSGMTHLAGAVGAPTVALFGPSNVDQWSPRGAKVMVLSLKVECAPCSLSAQTRCPHRQCLTMLAPGDVIARLVQFLAK